MGAEASRKSSYIPHADNYMPQVLNNHDPLKFHSVHGENVRLINDSAVASRVEGFCKGIVFTHRPVAVNEHIYIKILKLSTNWSGGLRIGFTSNDPNSYKQRLPKYACPCMTDISGNWARALAERFIQKESTLFFYFDQKGEVHFGLNNEERGVFITGVNTSAKLWAMMDIYGNTIRIELATDCRTRNILRSRLPETPPMLDNSYDVNWLPIHFHQTHGSEVSLSENRTVALKTTDLYGDSYTFTERAIELNECLAVEVLSTNGADDSFVLGLTSCNPDCLSLKDLPHNPDDLFDRPEYWVVNRVKEKCQVNDLFLFQIGKDGAVRYSKNGSPHTTSVFVDQTLKLWIFINLNKSISKIRFKGALSLPHVFVPSVLYESLKQEIPGPSNIMDSSQISAEGTTECVICYEANVNCALYRCGHVCMCYPCGKQLHKSANAQCPICREEIRDVLKIYK